MIRTVGQAVLDYHFPPEADYNSTEPPESEQVPDNEFEPEESRSILWFKIKHLFKNKIPDDRMLSDAAKSRIMCETVMSELDLLKVRVLARSSSFTKAGRMLRLDLTAFLRYIEKLYEEEKHEQKRQCFGLFYCFGFV
jgi:hypothetical protein